MREKKMVTAVLVIVLLGLIGLNIPTKAQMQAFEQSKELDKQRDTIKAANLIKDNETIEPETKISAVDQPVRNLISEDDKIAVAAQSSTIQSGYNLDSLAKVVYGEARGESFTGQVAIAAVVLNRVESDKFGNTVNEVIFEPGAFTAVSDGQYYMQPNQEAYNAAQAAIEGWDPTNNAIYYWNPATATNSWVWSRPITITIGKHVFAH